MKLVALTSALTFCSALLLPNPFELVQHASSVGMSMLNQIASLPIIVDGFDQAKQVIAGYPFELMFGLVHNLCLVAERKIRDQRPEKVKPDVNQIKLILRTTCTTLNFSLPKANDLWMNPNFDRTKKVVILATGFTEDANISPTVKILAKAFNCRGGVNFIALDPSSYLRTMYTWSAANTQEIGDYLGDAVARLVEIVPIENVHLIGHSLGSHIVGSAGRRFKILTGKSLPRITGLDPARPCFNEGEVLHRLQRSDAEFVDIIHTNSKVLGIHVPIGDVDFYPGGDKPLSPGCFTFICAHFRSFMYYAESIYPGNENSFLATKCDSMANLRLGRCHTAPIPMGLATPANASGRYFLEVNANSPFGKGSNAKQIKSFEKCGICNSE